MSKPVSANASGQCLIEVPLSRLQLRPLVYNGQRVLTLAMMDRLNQRLKDTAGCNFNRDRGKLTLGEEFFELSYEERSRLDEIRRAGSIADGGNTGKLILLTLSGYLIDSFVGKTAPTPQPLKPLVRCWSAQRVGPFF